MPEIRRDLVQSLKADAARGAALLDRARDAWFPEVDVMADYIGQLTYDATSYQRSELFWVTADMAHMAMDGALDVPMLTLTDCPAPRGLMCFGQALPPVTASTVLHGDQHMTPITVPVAGVAWRTMPDEKLEVDVLAHSSAFGKRSISPNPPRYLTPLTSIKTQEPLPLDLEHLDATDMHGIPGDPAMLSLLSLLAAAWTMMMTPTVTERRSLDARTGQASTPQTPPASDVSIIDLRPLRHVEVERDEATGRRLTVRHLVRGHWTHQPHGPGLTQRRLQWRAPYIKGPRDAPLKVSEDRVMVWRRA